MRIKDVLNNQVVNIPGMLCKSDLTHAVSLGSQQAVDLVSCNRTPTSCQRTKIITDTKYNCYVAE